ncbi:MAG TPA: sodium:proton antiporter, partial [Firmicutes bacterium]|nr:sodium:proton antiporter [Bacillota bacterium]
MIRFLANLCFAGSFLAFAIGTLGLFRLPDPYTRLHAVGMGDTMGVGLA